MKIELKISFDTIGELQDYLNSTNTSVETTTEEVKPATKKATSKKSTKAVAEAAPVVEPVIDESVQSEPVSFAPKAEATSNPFGAEAQAQPVAATPVVEAAPAMETHSINTGAITSAMTEIVEVLKNKGYDANDVGQMFGQIFAKLKIAPKRVSELAPNDMLAFYTEAKNLKDIQAKSLV